MTIYIITGHLGAGKTMGAVAMAKDYLKRGRPVASNMTLNLQAMLGARNKQTYTKLPAIPRVQDLQLIGKSYQGKYDENLNGFVLLDEAGTWLNSRDWSEKGRRELFQWVTHARKYGWDVGLIIQDYESLDAQIRRSVSEVLIKWMHFNKVVPFVGSLLPRIHMGVHRYYKPDGPVIKRSWVFGKSLYQAFDTTEAVKDEINISEQGEIIDARGSWSGLSNWITQGRYLPSPATFQMFFYFGCKCLVAAPILIILCRIPALVVLIKKDLVSLFPAQFPDLATDYQAPRKITLVKRRVLHSSQVAVSLASYRVKRLVNAS